MLTDYFLFGSFRVAKLYDLRSDAKYVRIVYALSAAVLKDNLLEKLSW